MSNTVEEDNIDDNFLNNKFPNINKFLDIDSPLISDISGIEHLLDNIKYKLNTNESQQEQITTCDDKNEKILNEINEILNNTGGETTNQQEDLGIEKNDIIKKIQKLKVDLHNIKDENEIALNELQQSRNEIIQHVDKILNEQIDKYYTIAIGSGNSYTIAIGSGNSYTYQDIQHEIKSLYNKVIMDNNGENYEKYIFENINNNQQYSLFTSLSKMIFKNLDSTKSNDTNLSNHDINNIFEQKANILKELYNKKNDKLNKKNNELTIEKQKLTENNKRLELERTQMNANNTILTNNNEKLTEQNKNLKEIQYQQKLKEQREQREQQEQQERQKEKEQQELQEQYGGVITLKKNVNFTTVGDITYLSIIAIIDSQEVKKNIGIVIPFDDNSNEINVKSISNKINSHRNSPKEEIIQLKNYNNNDIKVTNFGQGDGDRFHLALLLFKKVNDNNEKTYRLHYISSSEQMNYTIFSEDIIEKNFNHINETLENYNNNDDRVVLVPLLLNKFNDLKETLTNDHIKIKTTEYITNTSSQEQSSPMIDAVRNSKAPNDKKYNINNGLKKALVGTKRVQGVNKKTGKQEGTKGGGNNSSNVNIMALKNKTIRSKRGGYRYSDLGMKGLSILLTEEETNKSKSKKLIKGSKTKKNIKMMKGRKGNIGNKVNNKKSQYKKQSMKKKLKRTMKK